MHTAEPTEQSRREQTLLRRIISATLTVSGATTLVKIVGAAKVILIARAFGTSDQLDSYLLAFLLPSFVGDVVAGASSPALIPLLLEARQREGSERARRLLAEFLFATLIVCVSLTILLAAFAPILVRAIGAVLPRKSSRSQRISCAPWRPSWSSAASVRYGAPP